MAEKRPFCWSRKQSDVADCDTLIYYWAKNKPEAQFQLMNLLSLLPVGIDIFRGWRKPRSGVRAAPSRCWRNMRPLTKVDSARRFIGLYHGRLENSRPSILSKVLGRSIRWKI